MDLFDIDFNAPITPAEQASIDFHVKYFGTSEMEAEVNRIELESLRNHQFHISKPEIR